jgi:hypothetical protein
MRKPKEQVAQEKLAREKNKKALKIKEYTERLELGMKQQEERDKLREKQAARRREKATTGAGGVREGAGRPASLPHAICISNGLDCNPRKTMTFYGAADEKKPVKRFLQVWRKIRFELSPDVLREVNGLILYQLMTGQEIAPEDLEKLPPELAKIGKVPL